MICLESESSTTNGVTERTTETTVKTSSPVIFTRVFEPGSTETPIVVTTKETTTVVTERNEPSSSESTVVITTTKVTLQNSTTGYSTEASSETAVTSKPPTTAVTAAVEICNESMGLSWKQNHVIGNPRLITSSNTPDENTGRLNSPSSWIPDQDDESPWIQVDFEEAVYIQGVLTQGDGDQSYVSRYKIEHQLAYNSSFEKWKPITENGEFQANRDATSVFTNYFSDPVLVTSLRLKPLNWKGKLPSIRLDFTGCYSATILTTTSVETKTAEIVTTTKKVAINPSEPGTSTNPPTYTEVTTTREVKPTTTHILISKISPTGETTTAKFSESSSTKGFVSSSSAIVQSTFTAQPSTPATTEKMATTDSNIETSSVSTTTKEELLETSTGPVLVTTTTHLLSSTEIVTPSKYSKVSS